jgi:hypothetical protein
MTQEEFVKLKDKYSKKWADAHFNSFKEYDWDKFIRVEDASTYFGSTRRRYELYKNNSIITPYLDENKKYKAHSGKDNILMAQYAEFDSEGDYNNFYNECQKDISTRWNIWEFTLYPNGAYESLFIWNEQAYLDSLMQKVRLWFNYYFEQAGLRLVDKLNQSAIKFNFEIGVTISFTNGKSNPVLFVFPNHPEINFKLHLEQLPDYIEGNHKEAFEERSLTRITDNYQASLVSENEQMYHLMNDGELKNIFKRWNKATAIINPIKDVSFEDIKFEWQEENA